MVRTSLAQHVDILSQLTTYNPHNPHNNNKQIKMLAAFASTTSAVTATPSSVSLCMTASAGPSRRAFMQRSAGVASAAATGWFANFDGHSSSCQCNSCGGGGSHAFGCSCGSCGSHSLGCSCANCVSFGPLASVAYQRDVGGSDRSPEQFAQNLQVSSYVM